MPYLHRVYESLFVAKYSSGVDGGCVLYAAIKVSDKLFGEFGKDLYQKIKDSLKNKITDKEENEVISKMTLEVIEKEKTKELLLKIKKKK
ncbi:MAG: hypothetical protein KAQ84_03085 [Thermoplasmatales archaeon]|nr:hypothetical protein [Thermoplasmatales archaeon]